VIVEEVVRELRLLLIGLSRTAAKAHPIDTTLWENLADNAAFDIGEPVVAAGEALPAEVIGLTALEPVHVEGLVGFGGEVEGIRDRHLHSKGSLERTQPVPEHLQWDLWLGPAPERPYNPVYHPRNWRGWWDFGTGALGDMACHTANLPFMGLKLGLPTRISATSSKVNPKTYPSWATITYEFPGRGDLPPVKLAWYEGSDDGKRNLPKPEFPGGEEPTDSGCMLIGEKGRIYSPSDSGDVQRLDVKGQVKTPEPRLERLGSEVGPDENQKREWLRAIQGGSMPLSNFDYASVLTEAMLLGNVAIRAGKPIEYNGEKGMVTIDGSPLDAPTVRQGWELYQYRDILSECLATTHFPLCLLSDPVAQTLHLNHKSKRHEAAHHRNLNILGACRRDICREQGVDSGQGIGVDLH